MSTKTDPDVLSKRIAEVTQPVEGSEEPQKKKVPLTWEEEELAFYEPRRVKAVDAKRREERRAALLIKQLPLQWKTLCEVIAIRCESINNKAGRTVLRTIKPDENGLEVRREDDLGFVMGFDLEKKKIACSGKVLGFDREYELRVLPREDVDITAWFSLTTLATEQTDELAKGLISVLIRFDQ